MFLCTDTCGVSRVPDRCLLGAGLRHEKCLLGNHNVMNSAGEAAATEGWEARVSLGSRLDLSLWMVREASLRKGPGVHLRVHIR